MKIERLKEKRVKQIILVSLVFIGIVVTLVLITSKAKYKNIQSIDLASGTINYTPADIDIVAINIKNDSGEYESTDTIPSSGYTLNSTSYCNVNGEKDTNIIITYENGKVGVRNITKKVKCNLYFDKYSAIDKIIGDTTGIQEKTSFTNIATEEDTGIYRAPDDYGTSYYFRGLEGGLNNWVKFAGSYWRIVRINGNGTVRMIYSGAANGGVSSTNKSGTTTLINGTKYMYNHTHNDNAYVGYMMGIPLNGTTQTANTTSSNSTSYEQAHTNQYDSDAKKAIDEWYQNNINNNTEYSKHIDLNTGFCNDREIAKISINNYNNLGYGTDNTVYAGVDRTMDASWSKLSTQTPTLQCANKTRDLFTINTSDAVNKGNKELTYPIGMITMDEVIFAGGFYGTINTTYYLYTNQAYWTMSPCYYPAAGMFYAHSNGNLYSSGVPFAYGLRPVINLRADTKFIYNNETTKGSESDPYVVS